MHKSHLLLLLAATTTLSACFKDEAPNAECDILTAEVQLADWSAVFYHESDTRAVINEDYASSTIKFANTLASADLTAMAPLFTISSDATISPASGTVRDFSQGGQEYVVRSADGNHSRTYVVRFTQPTSETEYHFDDYALSDDGKYYIWDGNWATANPGFSVANGGSNADDYPTVPTTDAISGAAVRLTTCSTGVWGALVKKPLAAGNIFLGEFDLSKALTNTLESTHFGTPFNLQPLRFQGWYKYTPGTTITDADGNSVPGTDTAAIYARLYRNHDSNGESITLNGTDIATNPNIVARAEVPTQTSTTWLYFDIPFDYSEDLSPDLLDGMGYSLVVAASSSSKGDTYEGAIGSTLYIDEFRIVPATDTTEE